MNEADAWFVLCLASFTCLCVALARDWMRREDEKRAPIRIFVDEDGKVAAMLHPRGAPPLHMRFDDDGRLIWIASTDGPLDVQYVDSWPPQVSVRAERRHRGIGGDV